MLSVRGGPTPSEPYVCRLSPAVFPQSDESHAASALLVASPAPRGTGPCHTPTDESGSAVVPPATSAEAREDGHIHICRAPCRQPGPVVSRRITLLSRCLDQPLERGEHGVIGNRAALSYLSQVGAAGRETSGLAGYTRMTTPEPDASSEVVPVHVDRGGSRLTRPHHIVEGQHRQNHECIEPIAAGRPMTRPSARSATTRQIAQALHAGRCASRCEGCLPNVLQPKRRFEKC